MDQVDAAETAMTAALDAVERSPVAAPNCEFWPIAAAARGYPAVCLKMNRQLGVLWGRTRLPASSKTKIAALERRRHVATFSSLAAEGLLGATPEGQQAYFPALPVRGEIDIVGAGDSVTANLAVALAAGRSLASAGAGQRRRPVVIHQLGTTGTASVRQLVETLGLSEK